VDLAGIRRPNGPKGTAFSPEAVSIQTIVAVKRDGEWLFAAFQNTRSSSVLPAGVNRPEGPMTAENRLIHPTS
jgi:hypothetical protein